MEAFVFMAEDAFMWHFTTGSNESAGWQAAASYGAARPLPQPAAVRLLRPLFGPAPQLLAECSCEVLAEGLFAKWWKTERFNVPLLCRFHPGYPEKTHPIRNTQSCRPHECGIYGAPENAASKLPFLQVTVLLLLLYQQQRLGPRYA